MATFGSALLANANKWCVGSNGKVGITPNDSICDILMAKIGCAVGRRAQHWAVDPSPGINLHEFLRCQP
jgi:hypothetical protein